MPNDNQTQNGSSDTKIHAALNVANEKRYVAVEAALEMIKAAAPGAGPDGLTEMMNNLSTYADQIQEAIKKTRDT